jgi:hypothetical protein
MPHTNDELTQNLAERWCWEVARRDDTRLARRLYRTQLVDGVYRLAEGAVLDGFVHFLDHVGVMALRPEGRGAAIPRDMLPCVPSVVRYGLKPLGGLERIKALPALLFRDEALRQLGGCNAQQVRAGLCQRGAAMRQGERPPGPLCPDTLAKNRVTWTLRQREAVVNGAIRASAQAGVLGKKVTGLADGMTWRPPSASAAAAR